MTNQESNKEEGVVCKHCEKLIKSVCKVKGFSIICPHCGKPL